MIGSGGIASFPISGLTTGVALTTFTDEVTTREQRLLQPWPWLEFIEIETTSSGTLRYVDFQDPDAGGTLDTQVAFNGNDYDSRKIERGDIKASDGVPQFTVTIEDVARELITAVDLDDGLNAGKLHIHRIPYDLISKPYLAHTETFRIRQALATLGPDTVSLSVGLPSLADMQVPHRIITRNRCWNDYNRRFELDSYCRYPSDDFEQGTYQLLGSSDGFAAIPTTWPSAATARRFGWSSLNADIAAEWKSSDQTEEVGSTKLWTVCTSIRDDIRWSSVRKGLYMWKDLVGDFDLETRVLNTGARAEWMNGILLQDADNETDWLFWGNVENISSVEKMRVRQSSGTSDLDTPWCGSADDKLYLQSGNFTSTVKKSVDVSAVDNAPTGITWDGTNTPWCGNQGDKLYRTSGQFTTTVHESQDVSAVDATPVGISWDGTNTPWAGFSAAKLYMQSGQFTSTTFNSEDVSAVDGTVMDISWDGTNTPWTGRLDDKLYLQSGQFSNTVKKSEYVGAVDTDPRGISWDGTNTPWTGSGGPKLYRNSGQFTATIQDSEDISAVESTPQGICTNNVAGRMGTGGLVDADFDTTDGNERIRITRVGDAITCYSRVLDTDSWTQKAAKTWTSSPTSMRIGLLVASDDIDGATTAGGSFRHFRFASGGLVSCDRSEVDCDLHEYLHAYNGFSGIPNQRTRG